MSFFSSTVEAVLAGRTVRRARLVKFDFASGPVHFFEGVGKLRTLDGTIWSGAGELGSIGDIEGANGGQAPQVQFTLSGVDPTLIAAAIDASTQSKGREVAVFCQYYDEDWSMLDNYYTSWVGVMDTLKISGSGPDKRTIILNAESIFTARGFAAFAHFSDRDQKRLHPGDRGAEFVTQMGGSYVIWPSF